MPFFNFFSKRGSKVQNAAPNEQLMDQAAEAINVSEDLFVEKEVPTLREEVPARSALENFLLINYELKGLNDGYMYPNSELLDSNVKQIRSQLRLVLDQELDLKRSKVYELKLHAIDIKGISERLQLGVEEKIRQIEAIIHELDMQKILSVENEGIVGPLIHAYRIGFIKGVERYHQEKEFSGVAGLFVNHLNK